MSELLAYIFNLCRISEESGGVRTAYQYDILRRRAMARALERGEASLTPFFASFDRDMVREAKDKVQARASEAGKFMARGQNSPSIGQPPAAKSGKKGFKGHAGGKGYLSPTTPPNLGKRSRSPYRGQAASSWSGGAAGSNGGGKWRQDWRSQK